MVQSRRDFLKSAGSVGVSAVAANGSGIRSSAAQTRSAQEVRMIQTPTLDIGYETWGDREE